MSIRLFYCYLAVLIFFISCSGGQSVNTGIKTRPLEENKALEIISEILAKRGYIVSADYKVQLSNNVIITCDIGIKNETMVIEYITQSDKQVMGQIPPPAEGSKLYVLPASSIPPGTQDKFSKSVYVFFLSDRSYQYHFNPTTTVRADVTYNEVESRLTRDLNDFVSWYESKPK